MSVTHHHHPQPHASMLGLARHAHPMTHVAGLLASPLYRRVAGDVAAAGLPSGAIVLDVGTGPGQIPEAIAKGCPSSVCRRRRPRTGDDRSCPSAHSRSGSPS